MNISESLQIGISGLNINSDTKNHNSKVILYAKYKQFQLKIQFFAQI